MEIFKQLRRKIRTRAGASRTSNSQTMNQPTSVEMRLAWRVKGKIKYQKSKKRQKSRKVKKDLQKKLTQ